jgi:hypothetical protein
LLAVNYPELLSQNGLGSVDTLDANGEALFVKGLAVETDEKAIKFSWTEAPS